MVARRSAAGERTRATMNQARALYLLAPMTCGPGSPGTPQLPWLSRIAALRPRPATSPATLPALPCASWDGAQCSPAASLAAPGELIAPLVSEHAPGLVALYGIGPHTAALLLIAAGTTPAGGVEAARAHLCAAAPIPASSATSAVRTAAQTAIAYFWNANAINHMNQGTLQNAATPAQHGPSQHGAPARSGEHRAEANATWHLQPSTPTQFSHTITAIRNASIDGNPATNRRSRPGRHSSRRPIPGVPFFATRL